MLPNEFPDVLQSLKRIGCLGLPKRASVFLVEFATTVNEITQRHLSAVVPRFYFKVRPIAQEQLHKLGKGAVRRMHESRPTHAINVIYACPSIKQKLSSVRTFRVHQWGPACYNLLHHLGGKSELNVGICPTFQ